MVKKVIEKHADKLLRKKNVVIVYEGNKIKGGEDTGERALVVGVKKKEKEEKLSKKDIIPKKIERVKTDVVETDEVYALGLLDLFKSKGVNTRRRYRPMPCHVSVGNRKITAGTAGAFVVDAGGNVYVLSNAHVLCEDPRRNVSEQERRICQPGPYDSRNPDKDIIGRLERHVAINPSGNNYVDCALMRADRVEDLDLRTGILGYGYPTGVAGKLEINQKVVKPASRTTGKKEGRVTGINGIVMVNYGSFKARFVDQIIFSNMSAGGDSGSSILTADGKYAGLLFAGSSKVTIGNKAENVLNVLDVSIMTQGEGGEEPTPPEYAFVEEIDVEMERATGLVKGTITQKGNKQPLEGVEIYADNIRKGRSGADGRYMVELEAGRHRLEFRKPGYRAVVVEREFGKENGE
ncbi:MAG: hypothetical protein DRO95_06580 [Candidatus Altiarchaeales archaeon]|nr:MAG: hypothetical protein DRO95_06580 [Candidatus Altiarchaeales archaeon]